MKYVISIPNEERSKNIQEWLFEAGFVWANPKHRSVQYISSNFLTVEDGKIYFASMVSYDSDGSKVYRFINGATVTKKDVLKFEGGNPKSVSELLAELESKESELVKLTAKIKETEAENERSSPHARSSHHRRRQYGVSQEILPVSFAWI